MRTQKSFILRPLKSKCQYLISSQLYHTSNHLAAAGSAGAGDCAAAAAGAAPTTFWLQAAWGGLMGLVGHGTNAGNQGTDSDAPGWDSRYRQPRFQLGPSATPKSRHGPRKAITTEIIL